MIKKKFYDFELKGKINKIIKCVETPLTTCATNNDVEGITGLITEMGAFIEFRSTDGKTALHKAAAAGHLEALKVDYFYFILFYVIFFFNRLFQK